jgi:integrase
VAALDAWYAESVVRDGRSATGPVWPGRSGAPMHEHTPTQTCTRALHRAGLIDETGAPLVTLHGLRHTCASIMLMRGVPLIVVSRHLGHADVNITARVYAHLSDDAQLDQAATAFQSIHDGSPTLALGGTSRGHRPTQRR